MSTLIARSVVNIIKVTDAARGGKSDQLLLSKLMLIALAHSPTDIQHQIRESNFISLGD